MGFDQNGVGPSRWKNGGVVRRADEAYPEVVIFLGQTTGHLCFQFVALEQSPVKPGQEFRVARNLNFVPMAVGSLRQLVQRDEHAPGSLGFRLMVFVMGVGQDTIG